MLSRIVHWSSIALVAAALPLSACKTDAAACAVEPSSLQRSRPSPQAARAGAAGAQSPSVPDRQDVAATPELAGHDSAAAVPSRDRPADTLMRARDELEAARQAAASGRGGAASRRLDEAQTALLKFAREEPTAYHAGEVLALAAEITSLRISQGSPTPTQLERMGKAVAGWTAEGQARAGREAGNGADSPG